LLVVSGEDEEGVAVGGDQEVLGLVASEQVRAEHLFTRAGAPAGSIRPAP
jgi:hypothetical protein